MRLWSSTAKAGKLMMVRRPASISFELDSRGRRELSFVCVCVCVGVCGGWCVWVCVEGGVCGGCGVCVCVVVGGGGGGKCYKVRQLSTLRGGLVHHTEPLGQT